MCSIRIQLFKVTEEKMVFEEKIDPSQDDVHRVLGLIHKIRVLAINMPTLGKELKENGFVLPKYIDGLEGA